MNDRGHLSSPELDLLHASALSAAEKAAAEAHLTSCASCRALSEELAADRAHFQRYVFARSLPKIAERVRPSLLERFAAGWKLLVPASVVGLALLVVALRPAADPELGIKGGGNLQVFARREEAVFPVRNGTRLAPGDRIRFVVDPGTSRFVLIASVDGAGKVSVYFPPGGVQSAPVSAGRNELPRSIELDEVLGTEQLFAYFSDQPLTAQDVVDALSRGEPNSLPGVRPVVLDFLKERR